jgi:Leucine-rich repeat (LRR) protein
LTERFNKPCEAITAGDLLRVRRIAIPNSGLSQLKLGDFDGLLNLRTLNIKRNQLTALPTGIFSGLRNLRELVVLGNLLRELPSDFLVGNELIERVHFFQNRFTRIPAEVMNRFRTLSHLELLDIDADTDRSDLALLDQWFPMGGPVLVNLNER